MKRTLLSVVFVSSATLCAWTQSIVWHSADKVVDVDASASTGLSAVYVARSLQGVTVGFIPSSGNPAGVKWHRFSSLGAAYSEPVSSGVSVSGNESVLSSPQGNMGYMVEDGDKQTFFWVVDYTAYPLQLGRLEPSAEQDCSSMALDTSGTGEEIPYYTINGRRMTLSRGLELSYYTLEYNRDMEAYEQTRVNRQLDYLQSVIHVPAPLCSTSFQLTGDRFLSEWGIPQSVESAIVAPHAVACETSAAQEERVSENEVGGSTGEALGGSAPCVVTFKAQVSDAAIFHEWQFSKQSDFEDISLRMSDLDFTYSFNEEGVTYVRLYCANDDASCDCYGETYEISIGQSVLKCPNAFSPFNEDGVNDEWKVTYSSIVSFTCSIFNRYGKEMCSFNDPSLGWDGRYGGKFVPAGVYYYVIKARGADGKDYNLSGDINILDYK